MTDYEDKYFGNVDGLKQHYRDYPRKDAPVVLCMPGLTRNARDFDEIAEHLAGTCRVIAVEQRGRGESAWDPDPSRYQPATYVADMFALIDQENLDKVIAFGTSLGGLMTIIMQAMRPGVFVGAILNDIGPEVDPRGVARIQRYVGKGEPPGTWPAAIDRMKELNGAIYPDFTDADWAWFTRKLFSDRDGRPVLDYDPDISRNFDANEDQAAPDLWPLFESMTAIPVVVLRGELSDILSEETLKKMAEIHPDLTPVTVAGKGHVPLMTEPECLGAIDSLTGRFI